MSVLLVDYLDMLRDCEHVGYRHTVDAIDGVENF